MRRNVDVLLGGRDPAVDAVAEERDRVEAPPPRKTQHAHLLVPREGHEGPAEYTEDGPGGAHPGAHRMRRERHERAREAAGDVQDDEEHGAEDRLRNQPDHRQPDHVSDEVADTAVQEQRRDRPPPLPVDDGHSELGAGRSELGDGRIGRRATERDLNREPGEVERDE